MPGISLLQRVQSSEMIPGAEEGRNSNDVFQFVNLSTFQISVKYLQAVTKYREFFILCVSIPACRPPPSQTPGSPRNGSRKSGWEIR